MQTPRKGQGSLGAQVSAAQTPCDWRQATVTARSRTVSVIAGRTKAIADTRGRRFDGA